MSSIAQQTYRASIRLKDALRYSAVSARLSFWALRARIWLTGGGRKRTELLLRAYRLAESQGVRTRIRRRLEPFLGANGSDFLRAQRIGWARYPQALSSPRVTRTIVLKAPQANGERGVLLVMFEYNWLRLFANVLDLEHLNERFHLVLSTSWSPTDYALLGLALSCVHDTVFVQACNYGEIEAIEAFSPRIKCLPCIACDWINPDFYQPKSMAEREIDILMVANWAPFKRHWQLFDALRRMPKDLRVTLIGQTEGPYTVDYARQQTKLFGVKQDIEFLENVSIDEVTRRQCNSRISLILSRREGCCVAAVESLFADTPLALLRNAHIGPKAYINDQIGVLLNGPRLDYQLQRFLDTVEKYQPRAWAVKNISCFRSIEKVNAFFERHAQARNLPWTTPLRTPHWRPYPTFVRAEDGAELRPVYEDLHRRYPNVFGADLIETSVR